MRLNAVSFVVASLMLTVMNASPSSADDDQPKTLVTISKETTFLTEPLDEEGYVDYLAALNRMQSKGVTPENNAAVPLRRAMGLMTLTEMSKARDLYDRMLGIEPGGSGLFVPIEVIAKKHGQGSVVDASDLLWAAIERPWTPQKYPIVADWMRQNQRTIDLVIKATKRPRFYSPFLPGQRTPGLMSMQHLGLRGQRAAARLLVASATMHAGEGRADKALADILACHRLSTLVSQDKTLIGGLLAIAVTGTACAGDAALLDSRAATAQELEDYLQRLTDMPYGLDIVTRVDEAERMFWIDVIVALARGQVEEDNVGDLFMSRDLAMSLKEQVRSRIRWNVVLHDANDWYDRLHAALAEES